jgi:sphingosine kinase
MFCLRHQTIFPRSQTKISLNFISQVLHSLFIVNFQRYSRQRKQMSEIIYRDRLSILAFPAVSNSSPQQGEGILKRDSSIWCLDVQQEGESRSIQLKDAIGAFSADDRHPCGFVINTYPIGKHKRRRLQQYYFVAESLKARNAWLETIEIALRGSPNKPRPRLQIILNPASGRKQARKIWQKVAPVFKLGYGDFELRETTKAGELTEIIASLDLDCFDGLVIIGGDGTVYEAIASLCDRSKEKEKLLLPIGIIPSGTSNGLAKSILAAAGEVYDPVSAAFSIVKGKVETIDIATVRQQDKCFYSILSFAWGFVSDVDLESDRFRFLGTLKTDLYVLVRLFFLRTYRGKLSLFLATGETKEIDAEFILLWAMNVPWAAYNLYAAPHASLTDGSIDLLIIRAGISRWQILWAFLQVAKGKHIELPHLEYYKVRGFHLEPDKNLGILAIDGEEVPCLPTTLEVRRGWGRIFG